MLSNLRSSSVSVDSSQIALAGDFGVIFAMEDCVDFVPVSKYMESNDIENCHVVKRDDSALKGSFLVFYILQSVLALLQSFRMLTTITGSPIQLAGLDLCQLSLPMKNVTTILLE